MVDNYKEIIKSNDFRFNNYRAACNGLGEKVKSGESKMIQLSDWNRYFTYHKEGNAIIVDVIRDTPLPKENKRRRIKGKWTMLIQSILYDAFSKQKEKTGSYEIKGSKKDYMKLLGLCSPLYLESRYKSLDKLISNAKDEVQKKQLSSYLEAYHITDEIFLFFCIDIERAFTSIIANAFKSLENHNLISADKDVYIISREKHLYGDKTYLVKEYATEEEVKIIKSTCDKIAEDYTSDDDAMRLKNVATKSGKRKFGNIQILSFLGRYDAYKKEVDDALSEALNCAYVTRLTKIDIGSDADMNIIGEIDYDKAMIRMMDKTCIKLYDYIEHLHEKFKIEEETKIQYLVLLQEVVRDKEVLDDDMYSGIGEMYFY